MTLTVSESGTFRHKPSKFQLRTSQFEEPLTKSQKLNGSTVFFLINVICKILMEHFHTMRTAQCTYVMCLDSTPSTVDKKYPLQFPITQGLAASESISELLTAFD